MGLVGFHRTVPLVLHGTGWTHRFEGIGWDRQDSIGLSHLSYMRQVGFHWTVLCILHRICVSVGILRIVLLLCLGHGTV